MRIVHVLTYVSQDGSYGGPVAVAVAQCRALAERGHEVTLVAGWDGVAELEVPGVNVHLHRIRRIPRLGFAGLFSPALARDVSALARSCDVMHLHFARDLVQLPAAKLAQRHVATILQTHGMVRSDKRRSARLLDLLTTRSALRHAHSFLALTDAEADDLVQMAPGTPVVRVRNGVSIPATRAHWKTPPTVLFLARLHARKRPLAFVQMAALVSTRHPQTRFVMVGADEGELAAVRQEIVERGLGSTVTYVGAVSPQQVSAVMAAAQIYVLPSIDEPFPVSTLEAMAHGLATVITTGTGISKELRERDAVLVVEPTPDSLADAVATLLDAEEWARRSLATREDAEQFFSMDAVLNTIEATYFACASAARDA